MSDAVRKLMNVSEFLGWAERSPEGKRYELINGAPVAMAPEREGHAAAKLSVAIALVSAIRRAVLPCFALPDGMTVPIDEQTAYEPDALVYCGKRAPRDSTVVPNPVIIVEVASPSTRHIDAGVKLAGYFKV